MCWLTHRIREQARSHKEWLAIKGQAPFIYMTGAFVRKKECFSTTHGIMRAVMTIFERTRRAMC
ncbi:hypothetical protein EMIT0P294_90138 [Pseudomonas sp. IT-P294]